MQQKTDRELLESYVAEHSEAAFAELAARYSPLVYRTCWRVLGNASDAEEAAQAAFLVLARKAGSLRQAGRLNGWLHRVARLTALQALRVRATRERRQEQAATLQEPGAEAVPEAERERVFQAMDAELDGLSGILREAVVLRYLRGFSEQEAAAQAGCPLGTMKRRASDAIAKLRTRLARRGVALSGAALASLLASEASAAVPETLLPSLVASVKGLAATTAAGTAMTTTAGTLAKGAMKTMFIAKVKMVAAVTAAVVMTGAAVPVGIAVAQAVGKDASLNTNAAAIGDEAKAMFLRAVEQARAKDYKAAIQTLETLLQTYPDAKTLRPEALYWLGDCYSKAEDPAAAKRTWEQLKAEFPDSNWGKYARGRLQELLEQEGSSKAAEQPTVAQPADTESSIVHFIRLKHTGAGWDDGRDTGADRNFLERLGQLTGFKVSTYGEAHGIERLAQYPRGLAPAFVYITGTGEMEVSDEEVRILQAYLADSGMLWADCGGPQWDASFRALMTRVFPDKPLRDIPDDDPLFSAPFKFPNGAPPLWHHGGRRALGIKIQDRWAVFYHPGDMNDAWKTGHSGLDAKAADEAFKLGVNLVRYSFAHYLISGPEEAGKATNSQLSADQRVARAEALLAEGKRNEAIALLRSVLKTVPNSAAASRAHDLLERAGSDKAPATR